MCCIGIAAGEQQNASGAKHESCDTQQGKGAGLTGGRVQYVSDAFSKLLHGHGALRMYEGTGLGANKMDRHIHGQIRAALYFTFSPL